MVARFFTFYYLMLRFCYRFYVNSKYELTKKVVLPFVIVWGFSIIIYVIEYNINTKFTIDHILETFTLYCPPILFFQALILGIFAFANFLNSSLDEER